MHNTQELWAYNNRLFIIYFYPVLDYYFFKLALKLCPKSASTSAQALF